MVKVASVIWQDYQGKTRQSIVRTTDGAADLLAAAEAIEAVEWRDIASVPRDGSEVLLADFRPGTAAQLGAKWDSYEKAWVAMGANYIDDWTHWRPIPAPPEVKP